jgi:hypothetical protein
MRKNLNQTKREINVNTFLKGAIVAKIFCRARLAVADAVISQSDWVLGEGVCGGGVVLTLLKTIRGLRRINFLQPYTMKLSKKVGNLLLVDFYVAVSLN